MSLTAVSPNVNKNGPKVVIPITAKLRDYWDSTGKRYKSGFVNVAVENVTWTGTEEADEKAKITVRPAIYDTGCNEKAEYSPLTTSGAWGGSTFNHVTSINYGQPGPSAI